MVSVMLPKFTFRRATRPSVAAQEIDWPNRSIRSPYVEAAVDILDTKLFTDDFDMWFAKVIFQYHLAMAIVKEHMGHKVINPKAVLEQVEASYWKESNCVFGATDTSDYLGHELSIRINAARATKDDKTLETFLEQLSAQIRTSCRRIRNEKVVELDAVERHPSKQNQPIATSNITTSDSRSPEESVRATDTDKDSQSSSQTDVMQSATTSVQRDLPVVQPRCLKCKRPVRCFKVKEGNENGNSGREYFKCVPCKRFHSWADDRGIDPHNPLCDCRKPSRGQPSGTGAQSPGSWHYVCGRGGCDFFQLATDLKGHPIVLDEKLQNGMVDLKLNSESHG